MKRDQDLLREILFAIEDRYIAGDNKIFCLAIDGYDMKVVAEHCQLLFQQGLVNSYNNTIGGDTIIYFTVGNLTSDGYDYLELIRDQTVWEKTKNIVKEKKLPQTLEFLAKIAGIFTGNVISEMNDL